MRKVMVYNVFGRLRLSVLETSERHEHRHRIYTNITPSSAVRLNRLVKTNIKAIDPGSYWIDTGGVNAMFCI